jgi:hypothetical protein
MLGHDADSISHHNILIKHEKYMSSNLEEPWGIQLLNIAKVRVGRSIRLARSSLINYISSLYGVRNRASGLGPAHGRGVDAGVGLAA